MQISIQDAYAEACQVIGEQIVERRLLARAAPPEADEAASEAAAETPSDVPSPGDAVSEEQAPPKPADMRNQK